MKVRVRMANGADIGGGGGSELRKAASQARPEEAQELSWGAAAGSSAGAVLPRRQGSVAVLVLPLHQAVEGCNPM